MLAEGGSPCTRVRPCAEIAPCVRSPCAIRSAAHARIQKPVKATPAIPEGSRGVVRGLARVLGLLQQAGHRGPLSRKGPLMASKSVSTPARVIVPDVAVQ